MGEKEKPDIPQTDIFAANHSDSSLPTPPALPQNPHQRPNLPGLIPTVQKQHGLQIRAYQPEDDPYLMELERLCPRGEPRPFFHFRRRFIDRAMLYKEPYLFIAEKDGRPVAVTSIAIKDSYINGEKLRICYSFDTRVHPQYRRQGIANAMQEEKLAFLHSEGVHLIHTYVVATNFASMRMLEKVGFRKNRLLLHLSFPPYPFIIPPDVYPEVSDYPDDESLVKRTFGRRDLFIRGVANHVANFDYHRLSLKVGNETVSLSIFDQSYVYQIVSAEEAMPTEAEIAKRGRTWRIFNEAGIRHPEALRLIFDTIRDAAVGANVAKLSWLIDRVDPVPGFLFEESTQTDYWMLSCPLVPDWEPNWVNGPIYLDPRDL